jgi:hypothetical protein
MKIITEAMKKEGWKLVNGTWVAPAVEESSKEVSRILLEEANKFGPGWEKAPSVQPGQAAQVAGWKQLGLSDAEAMVAAGVVRPSPRNEGGEQFKELRSQLRATKRTTLIRTEL